MRDLLIEIGTEELPPSVVETSLNFISGKLQDLLGREDIETYATPRRLTFYVKGFEDSLDKKEELIYGPPWKVSFDEEGKPTKALLGFVNRYGASVEDVVKEKKGKGEYSALRIVHEGKSKLERLREEFEDILLSVPLPKRMRWTSSRKVTFSRPVRWILAMHGDRVIELSFGGVKGDNRTKGHRFLSSGWLELGKAEEYFNLMKRESVVVSIGERRELIASALKEIADSLDARVVYPEGLVEEVVNLVEKPFPVVGSFEERFLELPDRVITTVCAHHQRFFCLARGEKLINRFVGISNNQPKTDIVRRGYEKVIKARLEDALFFYREDLKRKLDDLVPKLSEVLLHPRIGSMLDKVHRLEKLALKLCELLGCSEEQVAKVSRAVFLSKADLLTEMVKELDELQGYMGYVYALKQGEDGEVAKAIYEQYKPSGQEDEVPSTLTGTILSLADRIDNLISFFSAGEIPKGSSDPYGLRRSAFGLLRILENRNLLIDLREFLPLYGDAKNTQELEHFLAQRLESYLGSNRYDIVRAVLKTNSALAPMEVIRKVKEISGLDTESLTDICEGYRRVVKILPRDWENLEVNEALLKEIQEINLWREVRELESGKITLEKLAKLRKSIDDLFDNVLIMDKDQKIKNNRLSLLKRVKELFNRYADFSEVVIQEV